LFVISDERSQALLPGEFSPFRFECEYILIPAYLALRRELTKLGAGLAGFEFQVEVALGPLKTQAEALRRQITLLHSYLSLRDGGLSVEETAAALRSLSRAGTRSRFVLDSRDTIGGERLPADEQRTLKRTFRHVLSATHPDVAVDAQALLLMRGIDPIEYLADAIEARVRGDLDRLVAISVVLDQHLPPHTGQHPAARLNLPPQVKAHHLRQAIAALQQERQTLLDSELAQIQRQALKSGKLDPAWKEKILAQQEFTLGVAQGQLAQLEAQLLRLGSQDAAAAQALVKELER
jgi:hypothetical protein